MAVPASLGEMLASAGQGGDAGQGAAAGGASAAAATSSAATPAGGGGSAAQTPEGGEAQPGLIGVTEDPAASGQAGQGQGAAAAGGTAWKLAEGVAPETVVAIGEDGKPITAAEIQRGYLRESDYTRKTQEAAELRRQAEEAIAWARQNEWFLADISSGEPAKVQAAIERIAQASGVSLGQGAPGAAGPARGADGRFVSSGQGGEQGGLQKIDPAQFVDEAFPQGHPLVHTVNALIDQLNTKDQSIAAIQKEINDFKGGVQQAMAQQQSLAELSNVAHTYEAAGLEGIDLAGAQKLVGQTITPAQAMTLHHFEKILRHNLAVARAGSTAASTPNEPAGVAGQNLDLSTMSLAQALEATAHSRG